MRRRSLMTVTALLIVAPAAVVAAQTATRFTDVPDGAFYEEAADALVTAGITTGCDEDPPRYCPRQQVTRAQMAAFLNRGLPRAAFNSSVATLQPLDASGEFAGIAAQVEVAPSGAAGGTGYVVLQGSVTLYADGDAVDCPCEVEARIFKEDNVNESSPSMWAQLPGEATSDGTQRVNVSLPVTWVTPLDAATTETFQLAVFAGADAPAELTAEGRLAATYVPFGPDGASVAGLSADPATPADSAPATDPATPAETLPADPATPAETPRAGRSASAVSRTLE